MSEVVHAIFWKEIPYTKRRGVVKEGMWFFLVVGLVYEESEEY